MQRINARLASLDLGFDPDHPRAPKVDVGERALRRIFNNGRFDHGGRLWGGFWQELSKRDRAAALALEGLRAVTLDYRQMGPRLLYARTRELPPADCYAVPGFERYRSGVEEAAERSVLRRPSTEATAQGHGRTSAPRGSASSAPRRCSSNTTLLSPLSFGRTLASR